MENLLQLVLTLAVVVVAVTLLVALGQLLAIRKALEALVRQGRMPAQVQPAEVSGQILPSAETASSETPPIYRPVVVSSPPPAPAPVEPLRFEEVPEPAFPENATAIASPPSPPAPIQQTRSEEAAQRVLPIEAPRQVVAETPAPSTPVYAATATSTAPPAEPTRSRLPIIIGIAFLVFAIGFLAFMVLYTK